LQLNATSTLQNYGTTLQFLNKISKERGSRYFLVQHSYASGVITVAEYAKNQSELANLSYTKAETNIDAKDSNIVLVAVDSVNLLRKAYPNYFLDTQEFSKLLSGILSR
jgi:hypothetical protein